MFWTFSGVLLAFPALAFVSGTSARWYLLALVLPALFAGYFAFRLVTLRVVLDDRGVCEPNPLRPTIITPWDDVVRVRRTEEKGTARLTFLGVGIEHKGGWKHQVLALSINTRDPRAAETIEGWLTAIREAKREHSS